MARQKNSSDETPSWIPDKVLDLVEDGFHVILTVLLFLVALGALVFSVIRLIETHPFFPNGMLQAVNDILFVVIILEIARTVNARFKSGFFQLTRFLIIGVIASVRHILSVGSALTLGESKTPGAFDRSIIELGINAAIVIALVAAILITSRANAKSRAES